MLFESSSFVIQKYSEQIHVHYNKDLKQQWVII